MALIDLMRVILSPGCRAEALLGGLPTGASGGAALAQNPDQPSLKATGTVGVRE
jgi:hypothetical protein